MSDWEKTLFRIAGTDEYALELSFSWSGSPRAIYQDAAISVVKLNQPFQLPVSTKFYNRDPYSRSFYPTTQSQELNSRLFESQHWLIFCINNKKALFIEQANFENNKISIIIIVYKDTSERAVPEYQADEQHKIIFDVSTKSKTATSEKV
jgi:hypothetical protein